MRSFYRALCPRTECVSVHAVRVLCAAYLGRPSLSVRVLVHAQATGESPVEGYEDEEGTGATLL